MKVLESRVTSAMSTVRASKMSRRLRQVKFNASTGLVVHQTGWNFESGVRDT